MKLILTTLALLSLTISTAFADLEKGLAAAEAGDYETAFIEYKKVAEAGDAEAQFLLSNMYFDAIGTSFDSAEGIRWLTAAANQDHHDAQFTLSVLYSNGRYVTQSEVEAFNWGLRAANNGNLMAHFTVGTYYMQGAGTDADPAKGIEWHTKGADLGLRDSQYTLGVAYENGIGVDQNYETALNYLREAAKNGMPDAITKLSAQGITISLDETLASNAIVEEAELSRFSGDNETAITKYKQAAEQNNALAQFQLGEIYLYGLMGEIDYVEAYNNYLAAGKNGDAQAHYRIGNMHVRGQAGLSQELVPTLAWFLIAAKTASGEDQGAIRTLVPAMTEEQLDQAEKFADDWIAEHLSGS